MNNPVHEESASPVRSARPPGSQPRWKGLAGTVNDSSSDNGSRRPAGLGKLLLPFVLMMSATVACTVLPPKTALRWSPLPPLPDALGVAGPFAGVCGDTLLVGGGANFPGPMPWAGGKKMGHDDVYALTGTNGHWMRVGKLPRPLAYGVSVTTDRGVVCLGGSDADRHYPDVFRLEFHEGELTTQTLPSLPVPLANAAGARVGATIYVAGGSEQPGELSANRQCFALDLAEKNPHWRTLPPCPGPARLLPVAAAWENAFYLFGGAALAATNGKIARVYLHDAWRYDPAHGWQRLADLPKPCVAGPTPAPDWDGTIYLVGGDDGSRAGFQPPEKHPGFPKTILAYDVHGDRWRTNGEVPAARATLPAVFWHDRFVLPSGEMRPGVRSPEVWTFRADRYP